MRGGFRSGEESIGTFVCSIETFVWRNETFMTGIETFTEIIGRAIPPLERPFSPLGGKRQFNHTFFSDSDHEIICLSNLRGDLE